MCALALLTYLLYLWPSNRWYHGPSMKPLHWILRYTTVTISCQVHPIFFTSDSMTCRQMFPGRHVVHFPCAFHVKACLEKLDWGFLSVWPIKSHFLLFYLYLNTGSWFFVLVHNMLLLTWSDHFTFMFLWRHLFTKVYIMLFTVCLVIPRGF